MDLQLLDRPDLRQNPPANCLADASRSGVLAGPPSIICPPEPISCCAIAPALLSSPSERLLAHAWLDFAENRLAPDWGKRGGWLSQNTRSTDLRKFRKYGISFQTTSDPDELAYFHDHLFEPYTRQRFGHLINGDTRDGSFHSVSTKAYS